MESTCCSNHPTRKGLGAHPLSRPYTFASSSPKASIKSVPGLRIRVVQGYGADVGSKTQAYESVEIAELALRQHLNFRFLIIRPAGLGRVCEFAESVS